MTCVTLCHSSYYIQTMLRRRDVLSKCLDVFFIICFLKCSFQKGGLSHGLHNLTPIIQLVLPKSLTTSIDCWLRISSSDIFFCPKLRGHNQISRLVYTWSLPTCCQLRQGRGGPSAKTISNILIDISTSSSQCRAGWCVGRAAHTHDRQPLEIPRPELSAHRVHLSNVR